jgi:hypothetical protein
LQNGGLLVLEVSSKMWKHTSTSISQNGNSNSFGENLIRGRFYHNPQFCMIPSPDRLSFCCRVERHCTATEVLASANSNSLPPVDVALRSSNRRLRERTHSILLPQAFVCELESEERGCIRSLRL